MICYRCGRNLSEHDFCTSCGADVSAYKKIVACSNRLYNEGLDKAKVRDLSGAILSLRQCLKLNKNHIEARNLLGLVYFETGEVVAALSEWVISKNLRNGKNIADDYIDMIQQNQTRLDTLNQTIKKYNKALEYCEQDALDLAVIQLKKVISLNPKFIRARQLLALLYINSEEWEHARKELVKCKSIDTNNTQTLRYLQVVEEMLSPVDGVKGGFRRKEKDNDIVKYQSGNETIIQPVNDKDLGGASTLLNIGIGLLIGVAVTWFLVLPARIQNANARADEQIKIVSEQLDAKTATIDEMQLQLDLLQKENQELTGTLDGYQGTDGKLQYMDYIMQATESYLKDADDIKAVGALLEQVDMSSMEEASSQSAYNLYNTLLEFVGEPLAETYYNDGYSAYSSGEYDEAIANLAKAFQYDQENVDALYYLAQSYNKSNDTDNARNTYQQVIDQFPDSEKAGKAESYLIQLAEPQDVLED